ncbi:hypothetical protein NDU88_003923 [Pleurodeles waltl]|uniref:Uncharacterized protein n=1 Tax=Pleurodeles waltl TaxID=8319 RepID=A0AAV7M622_PLEWA|nr:hypothetical protein NDU88_003923 [Pleurodeles waltl]
MPVTMPSLLTIHQSRQAGPARALLRRSSTQAQSGARPPQLGDQAHPRSKAASQQHQQVWSPSTARPTARALSQLDRSTPNGAAAHSLPRAAAQHTPPDPLGPRSGDQNPQNGP